MRDLLAFLPLFRPHWRSLLLGTVLTVITLLAGIGLLSLSGWFISASAIAGLTVLTRDQFNYLIPAGMVRFFSITRTASRWAERVVTHDATFRVLTSLRVSFWQKIIPLEPSWLQNIRQSDLLNRLITDIDTLDNLYLRLFNPLITGFIVLVCLTAGIYYLHSWQLAAVLGATWCLMLVLYPCIFYHLGKTHGHHLTQAQTHLRNHLVDYVTHLDTFLLFNAQTHKLNTITQAQNTLINTQRGLTHLSALAQGLLVACTGFISTGILALIILQPAWLAPGPVNAFVLFAVLASLEIFMPLAGAFSHTSRCQIAAKRVNQILKTTPKRTFGTHTLPAQQGTLNINDLTFSYTTDQTPLFKNFKLRLNNEEKVGIIGKTGCGKSTLAKILMRDLEPCAGTVTLDGTDISEFSEHALRASICLVSQRVDLFHDSLAHNLRIAAPDATDTELKMALQRVQLDYLALSETIGEGARTLSGGEKRRIGIARALLRKPVLVILDEPTEGLDVDTEQAIMHCCLDVFKNTSLLMISHRPTTLSYVDYCLTLEKSQLS